MGLTQERALHKGRVVFTAVLPQKTLFANLWALSSQRPDTEQLFVFQPQRGDMSIVRLFLSPSRATCEGPKAKINLYTPVGKTRIEK